MKRKERRAHPAQGGGEPSALRRASVAGLALISALGGVLVALLPGAFPGAAALALGMLGFLLLPFLLTVPRGKPLPTEGGETILTGTSSVERADFWARTGGAIAWLTVLSVAAPAASELAGLGIYAFLIGTACSAIAALGLWRRATRPGADAPAITLEAGTLTLRGAGGAHVLRYADVRDVRVEGATIWLKTATDEHSVRVEGERGAHTAARIAARIERAKAEAKTAQAGEAAEAPLLRRAPGTTALEWLTGLDAIAALRRSPDGYRRGGVDDDELWRTLADERADLDARAAAARVLTRGADDGVRVRVDAVVNDLPDHARVRVASALAPELEEAAAAVEAAELAELKRGIV